MWQKIKRFFYYGWVFRNSTNWDYGNLLEMIHIKMSDMYKCFEEDPWHSFKGTKRARKMKTAIICLERLMAGEYIDADYEKYRKDYPWRISTSKDGRVFDCPNGEDVPRLKKILEKEGYMIKQDYDTFTKIFKEEIQGWWV
jgi:hypothetical protein